MAVYDTQTKLVNLKTNVEITIDKYQEQIDKLKLSEKEVEKLKKKITKQEKKLKELENMIWVYDVGDIVLYKKDYREVKITKCVNIKKSGERYLYYGDFKNGSTNVAFTQEELIPKPYFHDDYIDLLHEKISELKRTIDYGNFR